MGKGGGGWQGCALCVCCWVGLVGGWWLADFFGGLSVVLYGFCGGWLVFFWNGVNFWGGCPIVSVVPVDIGSVGQSEKDKLK